MNVPPIKHYSRPLQRGSALIVGLIFLVLLTILGLTAMKTTTLEEKMAGNLRDRNTAFQSAETALRDAETYITNNILVATAACTGGICTKGSEPSWTSYAWDDSKNIAYYTSPSPASGVPGSLITAVAKQPKYIIVDLGASSVIYSGCAGGAGQGYKIIVRGWGQNPNTTVTLQEIFAKC